jgi:hypothetical protein
MNRYSKFTPAFNRSNMTAPDMVQRIMQAVKQSKAQGNATPVELKNKRGKVFAIVQFFDFAGSVQVSQANGPGFILFPAPYLLFK